MNSRTPVASQESMRSLSIRCRVFLRRDALPVKPRSVSTLTPYSAVGARNTPYSADRSSAMRSTMMVSHPRGICGPCCSHVPIGMMSRGSLPRMAVTCAGLSSFTRSGPETGIGEGSVIASADSPNVRSGRLRRRAILGIAAIPLFLIAMWVRTPALPRTAGPVRENGGERISAAEGAARALARDLADTRDRLAARAASALNAPPDPAGAFDFLSTRSPLRDGESVILFDRDRPLAWAGAMRTDVDTITAPVSATFSSFYVTLNVARSQGSRRAVAPAVLQAAPPADRLTESLGERLAPAQGVSS